MQDSAKTADLVIALGTSMGGLNADQMVSKCAQRQGSLGSVMINLQQTQLDGMMSVKIFGKTDDVLGMLMNKCKFTVPFDKKGDRLVKRVSNSNRTVLDDDKSKWTVWNLSIGAKVKLHRKNNCKGSQQPNYQDLPAKVGVITSYDENAKSISIKIGNKR